MSMRGHLNLTLGNKRAENMLESEEYFVYQVVSYDILKVILYLLFT